MEQGKSLLQSDIGKIAQSHVKINELRHLSHLAQKSIQNEIEDLDIRLDFISILRKIQAEHFITLKSKDSFNDSMLPLYFSIIKSSAYVYLKMYRFKKVKKRKFISIKSLIFIYLFNIFSDQYCTIQGLRHMPCACIVPFKLQNTQSNRHYEIWQLKPLEHRKVR